MLHIVLSKELGRDSSDELFKIILSDVSDNKAICL